MNDHTLEGRQMDVYVLLKILKYCTGSPSRSYQIKYELNDVFSNKTIDSTKDLGSAIKKVIHHGTLRGKFSSVHPDLAAEGITRVEVGEEGLHFITDSRDGGLLVNLKDKYLLFWFQMSPIWGWALTRGGRRCPPFPTRGRLVSITQMKM